MTTCLRVPVNVALAVIISDNLFVVQLMEQDAGCIPCCNSQALQHALSTSVKAHQRA